MSPPTFSFPLPPRKTNNASWRANTNTTARVSDGLARSVVRLGAPRCGCKFFGVSRSKHFSKAVAIACAPERGASTRWQLKIVQQFVKPRAAGLHPNVQAATDRGVPTRTKRQRARIGRPAQPHVSLGFEVRKRVPETALRHSRMIDVTWAAPLVDRVVGTWARSSAPSTLCATTCI